MGAGRTLHLPGIKLLDLLLIYIFFQSERGYSFEVRIRKDAKRNRFTSYQYEIYKSDDGYFIEERKLQYLSDFKVKLFEILSLKIFRSIHSK